MDLEVIIYTPRGVNQYNLREEQMSRDEAGDRKDDFQGGNVS